MVIAAGFQAILKDNGDVDLIGTQGKTWYMELTLTDNKKNPIDITGWTIRGQIRKSYNSNTVIAEWDCQIVDASNGIIKITLPASITKNITCGETIDDESSIYVYDIEAEKPDGFVLELMRGHLYVKYEVTKE